MFHLISNSDINVTIVSRLLFDVLALARLLSTLEPNKSKNSFSFDSHYTEN